MVIQSHEPEKNRPSSCFLRLKIVFRWPWDKLNWFPRTFNSVFLFPLYMYTCEPTCIIHKTSRFIQPKILNLNISSRLNRIRTSKKIHKKHVFSFSNFELWLFFEYQLKLDYFWSGKNTKAITFYWLNFQALHPRKNNRRYGSFPSQSIFKQKLIVSVKKRYFTVEFQWYNPTWGRTFVKKR